jgi:hypothetical protein
MAGEVTEALDVDHADLLNEHASRSAIDVDLGPTRSRFGARRRWRQHLVGQHLISFANSQ